MASTGCQWRFLPKDFPPYSTVQGYFYEWSRSGLFMTINHALVMDAREKAGREASPSAGVIDSQSVKTMKAAAHEGLMQARRSQAASATSSPTPRATWSAWSSHCQYPGSRRWRQRLAILRSLYPWLRHIFADGGYAGNKLRDALTKFWHWTIEIIKRSDHAAGFQVLPRRWVVERTFAWLGRCRRLAKDFETTIASAVAWSCLVAHIRTLTRRLARP